MFSQTIKHANFEDKVALRKKQGNLKFLEYQELKWEKSKDGVNFIHKSFFHIRQMGRIFVLNFNVLQKLTRPAAQQHPQVSGNWQEHFILNPQQDERQGISEPIWRDTNLFAMKQTRNRLRDVRTSTQNTRKVLILRSFTFWLITGTRFAQSLTTLSLATALL